MTPGEKWSHHASNLLVGGTGVVYGIMRYFMEPADPFSVVNHPWQPHFQHLHVLLAPWLVFTVGWSWQRHIQPRLQRRDMARYSTGITLALTMVPMVASGYLIQTTVDPTWRKIWIGVHLTASVLWILGYVIHQLQPENGKNGRPSRGGLVARPTTGDQPRDRQIRLAAELGQGGLPPSHGGPELPEKDPEA